MTHGRAGALAALFFAALALRPQIVGLGPLFPEIQDDLDVSHAVVGLLGTIPVLCMGLFAAPAPYLAARFGTRASIAFAVGLIGVFGVLRALAPGAGLVVLLTWPIGVGMGLAGALAPVAVKERFADRPATATGGYTTGIQVGSAVSAALAVPLAAAFGGWRAAAVVFSIASCGLAAVWLGLTRREPPHARVAGRLPRPPWHSRIAWLLVAIFALMACTYYGVNSWLPDSLVEQGWDEKRAGAVLALLNIAAIPGSFVVPWLSELRGGRRPWLIVTVSSFLVGVVGFAIAPDAAFLWAVFAGLASGAMFALVMTLPLDNADRPASVAALASMMLGLGYTIGALSPLVLGALRDTTGSFTAALWVIVAFCGGMLVLATMLPKRAPIPRRSASGETTTPTARPGTR